MNNSERAALAAAAFAANPTAERLYQCPTTGQCFTNEAAARVAEADSINQEIEEQADVLRAEARQPDVVSIAVDDEGATADFSAESVEGEAPFVARFNDASVGRITAWQWDFGDGSTSTTQSPTHTYIEAGVYDVSLTIRNVFGDVTDIKSGYITVTEPG